MYFTNMFYSRSEKTKTKTPNNAMLTAGYLVVLNVAIVGYILK